MDLGLIGVRFQDSAKVRLGCGRVASSQEDLGDLQASVHKVGASAENSVEHGFAAAGISLLPAVESCLELRLIATFFEFAQGVGVPRLTLRCDWRCRGEEVSPTRATGGQENYAG